MGEWVDGVWSRNFSWRRDLSNREQNLVHNLQSLVSGIPLVRGVSHAWTWTADPEGFYSVCSTYKMMQGPYLGSSRSYLQICVG